MSARFFSTIPKITIEGKSIRDHLRFAAAYWHVMRNPLADPFGGGRALMPWDDGSNSVANAQKRVRVFFEFLEKIAPSQPAPTPLQWRPGISRKHL
jgi:xylose isomerase